MTALHRALDGATVEVLMRGDPDIDARVIPGLDFETCDASQLLSGHSFFFVNRTYLDELLCTLLQERVELCVFTFNFSFSIFFFCVSFVW